MNKSETIDKLAAALSKAQGQITGAIKDSDNPFFKSKYADLASVWDACRKALCENGLSVVQTTDILNEKPILRTTLLHASGQWIEGVYPIISAKPDAQGMVAGLTYSRRAALAAIVGVAAIEDDDGNTAAGISNDSTARQPAAKKELPQHPPVPTREQIAAHAVTVPSKPAPKPSGNSGKFTKITAPQAKRLHAIAAKSGISKEVLAAKLRQTAGTDNAYDIHPDYYEKLCKWAETATNAPSKQAIEDMKVPTFNAYEDVPWGDEK
jgi:ERF superfamily